jgi:NAD(P)H-flavin reductase
MEVARPGAAAAVQAVVESKVMLASTVCRLRLKLPASFSYRAGQSILLQRSDGLMRSYSLASVPHLDEYAELHIRLFENGAMSRWIFEDVAPGDPLSVRGPFGDCMYMPGFEEASMLLLATGTGFAPIIAIARDALSQGHTGRIVIVHGVRHANDAYSRDSLQALAAEYPNVETMLCVSRGDAPAGFFPGRAVDVAFERFPNLGRWRVYLCGAPAAVAAAKKEAYLAGARMDDICADAFEQSARSR